MGRVKTRADSSENVKFKKTWALDPKLKKWITKIPGEHKGLYCKICQKDLKQAGPRDIYKHENTVRHQQLKVVGNAACFPKTIFKKAYKSFKESSLDASITSTTGDRITIDLIERGDGYMEGVREDECYEKVPIESQYKEWLEVDGPIVRCTICNFKIKSTRLDVFKHSIGKGHLRKLARKSGKRKAPHCDPRIITSGFRQAMDDISFGIKTTIDLRNDYVMTPGTKMKETMMKANPAGGEIVIDLQRKAATLLNKDAGLWFPYANMANTVAVLSHGRWNCEVIMGDSSLQLDYFCNSTGRVKVQTIANVEDGTFILDELEEILLSKKGKQGPPKIVVCVENTHTRVGGKVLPIEWQEQLGAMCASHNASLHLDGLRFINAALFYQREPHYSAEYYDSITFCLCTGLGAPMGAILVGSYSFIERAKELRQMLGGTLPKMGLFAAAGLYALEKNNVERVLHDHKAAKKIAKCIFDLESPVITVKLDDVQTNIIHLYTDNVRISPKLLCARLEEVTADETPALDGRRVSILATPLERNVVQLMIHAELSLMDVELIEKKFKFIIQEFDTDQLFNS